MANTQYYGTGRRKSSVARVRLIPGNGNITVNKKPLDEYLAMEIVKREVKLHYLPFSSLIITEYFIGTVEGELACHMAVTPWFHVGGYRATRLVTMPEWQGAGVGTRFLNEIAQYHLDGNGRKNKKLPTYLLHYLHFSSLIITAEDAGLDLINKVVPAIKLTDKTLVQMINTFKPADWTLRTVEAPQDKKTYEWDGENTATERINSVANLFGCEVFYSFVIERFQIIKKVINIVKRRGTQNATAQLRLNRDINKIVTNRSISELATAYQVTGGTPTNSSTPINLKGFDYSYTASNGDVVTLSSLFISYYN